MREPGLSPTQLNSYLAEFSHFDATKAAGCKGVQDLGSIETCQQRQNSKDRQSSLQTILEAVAHVCPFTRTDLQQLDEVQSDTPALQ